MTESNCIPSLSSDSFVLGKPIGRGSNGVYQGKHQGAAVEIKQMVISKRTVQKELNFLVRLRRCNFVCEVIGYNYTNSTLSIVMALAENGDLQQYLRRGNLTGDWSKKARICWDIAKAIDFIHAEKIIHKNLKAANILLDRFLTPKLTNFGSKNLTSTHQCRYISPEQLKYPTKKFTFAEAILSDNYSYGLVLWEVATDGMLPYDKINDHQIKLAKRKETDPLEYVGELSDDTPQVFPDLIAGFLESDPSKRSALRSALYRLDAYIDSKNLFDDCNLFADCEISAFPEVQQNLLKDARQHFRRGMNKNAIENLQGSPLLDQPVVQRALGLCSRAIGKKCETFSYFKKAALGDHEAQLYLAWCFEHGYGTEQDRVGALLLYALAAAFGIDKATAVLSNGKMTWCNGIGRHSILGNKSKDVGRLLFVNELVIDSVDRTFQHWAAENGYVEVVRLLAGEFEADVNSKDKNGWTPLHLAAVGGHVEIVKLLAANFRADVDHNDKNGRTPVHRAAEAGQVEVMRMLAVEFKADVNAKDKDGWTPLHLAAMGGHVEIVRLLAAKFKVDINIKDKVGRTPAHRAAWRGHVEVVELLAVEFRADTSVKDMDGRTPLHQAAGGGSPAVVRLLMSRPGADVNVKDEKGWTPLHGAAKGDHGSVVRLLVTEFRADVNTKDKYGRTPLYCAAQAQHIEVMRLLAAELGADVNTKDIYDKTPLYYVAQAGYVEVMRLLVSEFGADVNAKDKFGRTPLISAIEKGHVEVVRLLVTEFGADVNIKDKTGTTPLDWAVGRGHVDVVRLLATKLGIHRGALAGHFPQIMEVLSTPDDSLKEKLEKHKYNFPNDEKKLREFLLIFDISNLADYLVWIPYHEFNNLIKIGEGGFSTVYKATVNCEQENDRPVALKEMKAHNPSMDQLRDELIINIYLRFNGGFHRLTTPPLIGLSRSDKGRYIIVMEYATGGNLETILLKHPPDNWQRVWRIATGITERLQTIHKLNLIHHDLHPGNIVFTGNVANSNPMIIDVGICKAVEVSSEHGSDVYGRFPYLPPEVFEKGHKPFSQKFDIYCLGTLLWQLTSCSAPRGTAASPPELPEIYSSDRLREVPIPGTPEAYENIYKKCWNPDPELRPSVDEVLKELCDIEIDLARAKWLNDIPEAIEHMEHMKKLKAENDDTFSIHSSGTNCSRFYTQKELTEN